jgi:hypothetical protein
MGELGVFRNAALVVPDGEGLGPEVGSSVATLAGSLDGNVVGLPVGRSVGVKVLGRCDTGADGADVASSVGVARIAPRGTGFSGHLLNCKRRPGFRDKLIVVVSADVPEVGNGTVAEGQTNGTSCFHVQSGPPTSSVTGSS